VSRAVNRSAPSIRLRNCEVWRIDAQAAWLAVRGRALLEQTQSLEETARLLGRTRVAVKLRNARWGVPVVRTNAVWAHGSFFDTWSADTAYVLGFVATDGNVDQSLRCVTISQSHDFGQEHLKKIQTLIGGTVYGPDKNDSYQLKAYSRPMAAALNRFGLTPAKSLTLQLPPVPDEFFWPFFRGLFDGDGSVSRAHKKGERPDMRVSVASGSRPFLTDLSEKVQTRGIKPARLGRWEAVWSGSAARAILELVYADSGALCLTRKRKKYLELFAERAAWGDRRLLIAHVGGKVQGSVEGE